MTPSPVRILPQDGEPGVRCRVRLAGFPDEREAAALGERWKTSHPGVKPLVSLQ